MEKKSKNLFGEDVIIDDGVSVDVFDAEDIVRTAFADFRKRGFPYPSLPLFKCKMEINELANLPLSKCLHSKLAYRVADTYNKHRFHSHAIDMFSPFDSFMNDDKLLKVLRRQYEEDRSFEYAYLSFMSLVNGTQACFNFRPAFAKLIYNKNTEKGAVVFDSSTGYGGRLVGFLASHCDTYHGTDPNTMTFNGNNELSRDLKGNKHIYLYNSPIEDLDIQHLIEKCDFSFTSPPYFKKEIYSDEKTQSCNRYPEYNDWIEYFLKPMIDKQYMVLKDNAMCVINIEDVVIDKTKYKLVDPVIEIAKSMGFEYLGNDTFPLPPRVVKNGGKQKIINSTETIIKLRKDKLSRVN